MRDTNERTYIPSRAGESTTPVSRALLAQKAVEGYHLQLQWLIWTARKMITHTHRLLQFLSRKSMVASCAAQAAHVGQIMTVSMVDHLHR